VLRGVLRDVARRVGMIRDASGRVDATVDHALHCSTAALGSSSTVLVVVLVVLVLTLPVVVLASSTSTSTS
jgi:hypothetical protein